jgi:hypothetical protein
MTSSAEDAVRQRIDEVDEYIARLERSVGLLASERIKLVEALEAIISSESNRSELDSLGAAEIVEALGHGDRSSSSLPSLPDLVVEVLRSASLIGEQSLTPQEITARIRAKWSRSVAATSIGPIAWRMARDGRLVRDGGAYALPN